MKNKKNVILGVSVAVLAVAFYLGGQALVERSKAAEQAELEVKQAEAARLAAQESANAASEVVYTLPIQTPPSKAPAASETAKPSDPPVSETVKVEEDGSVTIIPDFEAQINAASKVVTPGAAPTANMGGSGGGDLPLGDDGVFHGDNPATPKPVINTPAPTVAPTPAPAAPTPDQGIAPAQTAAPAPEPSSAPQGSTETAVPGGPPNRDGKYDGERTPDGKYEWWGLGINEWVEVGGSNGGTGGQIDDSDRGWAPGEGGETVGTM